MAQWYANFVGITCMQAPTKKNGISRHLSAISTLVMCPHLPFHACLLLLRASHVLLVVLFMYRKKPGIK